ncbi:MAG: Bax inhibitor-1/YccA family protein [Elusimicrobiota bacterium]|jgi:uncharacterized YccA/Bax inhibitor family protein|nr:Bax inhibitor-1/YccA family protein [Elusimicrobiota bacterium]
MPNPLLKPEVFTKSENGGVNIFSKQDTMTVSGTINKSIIMLLLLIASAWIAWTNPQISTALLLPAVIVAFILAMICAFKPTTSPYLAPIYAIAEGLALGCISLYFNQAYEGIVGQAIFLTFAVLFCMLAAYRIGLLRATPTFTRVIVFATLGIAVFYLVNMVIGFFGKATYFQSNSSTALIINIVIAVIAALNLILDFDLIDRGAQTNAPKYMEWYCSLSLMITLVWLYLEILRLLARTRNR